MKILKKAAVGLITTVLLANFSNVFADEETAELAARYEIASPDILNWGGWGYYYGNIPEATGTDYTLNVHETPGKIERLNTDISSSNYGFEATYPQFSVTSSELLAKLDGSISYETYIKLNKFTFDRSGLVCIGDCYTSDVLGHTALYVNREGTVVLRRNFENGYIEFKPSDTINSKIKLNEFYHIAFSYDPSDIANMPVFYINAKRYEATYNVDPTTGGASGNSLSSKDFVSPKIQIMRLVPDTFNPNQHSYADSTWVMSAIYTGILSDEQVMSDYLDIIENNSAQYILNVKNNSNVVAELDGAVLTEGSLEIEIDTSGIDSESLQGNIALNDETVKTNVSENTCKIEIPFISEGEYSLVLKNSIKKSDSTNYRTTDKKYNFSVSYNSELRDRTLSEINALFADEAKTNEEVMNTVINDYNYILSLDVSETSNFSKIINKDSVFGLLRKQSYTSIDAIKTAFEENVQLQAKKDIDDGISEFNKALSEKNLTNLKDVIFIKYQTVFKLDTAQYDTLSDKDKALSNMFGKTTKTIDDVAELFANAVSSEKLNERKTEFINGLSAQTADTLEDYLTSYSDISETDMQNADFIENKTKVLQDILDADIKSTDELKKVFYQSVLLNAMNGVKVGNRAKTEQLLTVYSDYYTAPKNFKNAGNSLKEKLYRNITDGRTYANIADMEKQIEFEMKKIKNSENSGNTGGSSSGGGGSSRSDSVKSPSYSADTSVKDEEILPTPVEAKTPFTDLKDVSWALIPIETLYEKGVINGKSETEFVPNDYVTRAEFAKIVSLAFEIQTDDTDVKFSDVNSDEWCAPFVNALNKTGIISGISDILFGKNDCLTRADMAVILKRIAGYRELTVTESEENESFTDNDSIPEYARKAVNDLKASGILNGMGDNSFVPLGYVTRAQAAKAVYAVMNLK